MQNSDAPHFFLEKHFKPIVLNSAKGTPIVLGKSSKHVFISYEHNDREIAATLERSLSAIGLEVWWDERLQTGQTWAQEIDHALLHAAAVVVLWSKRAVHSEWVRHEASIAKIRSVLTHTVIDGVSVPEIFGSIQCSDLSNWDGSGNDHSFRRLVDGIKSTRRKNTLRKWRRSAFISFTTLIVASALIYGGYKLKSYLSGPGQKTVTSWNATTDYVEITLDMQQLRRFYNPKEWDVGFLCREYTGKEKGIDQNSSFAVIPMDKTSTMPEYKIEYHSDMARGLSPASSIECDISAIEKSLDLTSHTQETEDGFRGFKWSEKTLGEKISFTNMVDVFRDSSKKYATVFTDICSCALEYEKSDEKPL